MALTVAALIDQVRHATRAENTSAFVGHLEIVNEALDYFSTMHTWQSMIRPQVSLDTVASQDHIVLPSDVRDVLRIEHRDGVHNYFRWVTAEQMLTIRAYDDTADAFAWGYYGVLERGVPASGGGTELLLALYPTPASTEAALFTMAYRARLTAAGTGDDPDTSYIPVPEELEGVVRRLVRIFALAIEEENKGSVEERLQLFEGSQYLLRKMEWDGSQQPWIGAPQGGAAQSQWLGDYFGDEPVDSPS